MTGGIAESLPLPQLDADYLNSFLKTASIVTVANKKFEVSSFLTFNFRIKVIGLNKGNNFNTLI